MPDFKSIFKVVQPGANAPQAPPQAMGDVSERIRNDIESNDILIYMKGTPDMPQCGFSAQVIEVFNELGVKYNTRNVLADPAIRQGIKEFSNWPTVPQIYLKGKFLGGCDIVTEMSQRGELRQVVEEALGK
jgi:monothiol glutaredoxin